MCRYFEALSLGEYRICYYIYRENESKTKGPTASSSEQKDQLSTPPSSARELLSEGKHFKNFQQAAELLE